VYLHLNEKDKTELILPLYDVIMKKALTLFRERGKGDKRIYFNLNQKRH